MLSPGSVIDDVPIALQLPGRTHYPMNWDMQFHGFVTVRKALQQSYNIPALKTMQMIQPHVALEYARKMGLSNLKKEDENLGAAIGGLTYGLTVEEATSAFTTFPNAGVWKESHLITKIVDRNGKVIYQHKPKETRVFSPQTTYVLTDMMKDIVQVGTAGPIGAHFPGKAIAGKTGTTDYNTDAWFVGFTPNVTLGIWLGYDIPKPMHDSEGVRALNLWNQIMDRVYKKFPQQGEFPGMPGGIIRSEFCTKSGKIPTDLCRAANTVSSDLFVAGTEPKEPCDVHVKVKYAEINGKKYMVDDKVTALGGVVKEGIFIKREPYTLPYNNPKYKPLDADLELPEEFGKDDKDKNKNDNSPSVLGLKVMESRLDAITIGWEPVQGAEGYVVLRATSPAGPFAVLSELVTTNSYKDTAVQAGTTYYYQISVIANGSIQPAKDALEAVPGMLGGGKLQPPTGVTVVSTPVGITVSWQPAAGATQYLVYRSYDGSSFELITVVSGTGYQDVTAQGSNVWYKVSAKNEAEQSAMSAPVKAGSGTQGDSLSAPLLTAEKTESGNVQLSWNSVPGAVRYQIERHSGSSWQEITEVTGTQYTDTELNQNTAYSYRVYAVNATGQKSPVSNVVKVQP